MRNLKKVLSLVLCVAMLLSVMVMGTGAVTLTDSEDISPQYREAAEVLTGMGIINGYEDDSFKPQQSITRAEVATMIYRAATSDVTDSQTGLYVDYDKFTDVTADDWYAGYVNFCGNAELIKGFEDDSFRATENVTGYQVLAMILRAIGYDQNGEFTGTGWEIRTASTAQGLGILKNVQEATLGSAATRELVAELIFQAMNVDMVKYTPALNYVKLGYSLGQQEFDLTNKGDNHDDWGRPGTLWTYNTGDESTLVKETALATYTTAVTECDVADALDFDGTKTFTTYTNGVGNAKDYKVQATDTVGTIGAQGRITEVYEDEIVYIDTYLANVTDVKDATFDTAGHLKTSSSLTLDVWTASGSGQPEEVTLYGGSDNYSYAKGDMILISAVDGKDGKIALIDGTPATVIDRGEADSIVGAQTTIWNQTSKHTIDGETYDDASTFYLDQANSDANHDYTWYFDQFGNLIGATEIEATYNYAVLKDIRWIVGAPGYAQATLIGMDGEEFTTTVSTMDGWSTLNTHDWEDFLNDAATEYRVNGEGTISGNTAYIAGDTSLNEYYEGYALYRVSTDVNGISTLDGIDDKNIDIISIANNAAFTTGNTTVANKAIVDNATIFIVNNEDGTYSRYVGKDAMFSYTNGQIFYVDADGDKVVDYVYVRDCTPTAETLDKLVMATGESYTGPLTDGQDNYWVLNDGIRGTATEEDTIAFTNETPVKTMTSHVNHLYVATCASNSTRIDSVQSVGTTAIEFDTDNDIYVVWIACPIYAPGTGTLITGNSQWEIASDYTTYNVSNATVVGDYTSLSDVTNWADVNVFVVYTTETDGQNTASTVYVTDKVDTADPSDPVAPTEYSVSKISGQTPQATLSTSGKTLSVSGMKIMQDGENFAFGTADATAVVYQYMDGAWVTVGTYETTVNGSGSTGAACSPTFNGVSLASGVNYQVVVTVSNDTIGTLTLFAGTTTPTN